MTCARCGQLSGSGESQRSRPAHCSLGCALVGRVPVDLEGQYPINAAVVCGLLLGLLAFNELLFAALASVLAHREQLALAARCRWISAGNAAALWLGVVGLSFRLKTMHTLDQWMFVATLAEGAWLWSGWPPAPWALLGVNALLLLVSARGLSRKSVQRKSAILI